MNLSHTKLIFLLCGIWLSSCSLAPASTNSDLRQVTILYTNDEHGWMEGMEENQGAANIFSLWQSREDYSPEGAFLVLSGGDNWTGPAISTWTEGASMVEVMNAMHYDASAVGNHEFDFGLEVLAERAAEADYPYLSANTRWKENNSAPTDIGILPYTLKTVNDVTFGIIGLTTQDTVTATNPRHVEALNFINYETALRETIPAVQQQHPDLLVVIAHVCEDELEPLIKNTRDLGIAMFGAGHCNELMARRIDETILLGGGFHFTAYAKASFTYDIANNALTNSGYSAHNYENRQKDGGIAAIVSGWSAETEEILSENVGFAAATLPRSGEMLRQAIVNSWLASDPSADVAITNAGGIRIDLPAGQIDVGTVVSLMPFDNTIIAVDIEGSIIEQAIEQGTRPIFGGLERRGNSLIVTRTGEALASNRKYRVLINSFMYDGGDGYTMIREADPNGFDTGINYRQPFQDWLQSQNSSANRPLKF